MNTTPLKIDLQAIIKSRLPQNKSKFIPTFLIKMLEKLVCQEELNGILNRTFPHEGVAFADAALSDLNITVDVVGLENIPSTGRFIFASNHPLGGLDGIALIKAIGGIYGDENFRFLVNDMLMNVRPLRNVFLPINKYGAQGRSAAVQINKVYESDRQMIIFPAGLVSRKQKGGEIKDLQWQKAFIVKAIEYQRDIIPVFFEGFNSLFFYNFAKWRKCSGLKFNIEQVLLPSEVCKSKGKHFRIHIGKPISWQSLVESKKTPMQLAADVKEIVYNINSCPENK